MSFQEEKRESIKRYMLEKIREDDKDFIHKTRDNFQISITTVKRYIKECLEKAVLAECCEALCGYRLTTTTWSFCYYPSERPLDEDEIYYNDIYSLLEGNSEESKSIWYYSFSEIMNNAIEHAKCEEIQCVVMRDYLYTEISILDDGIGIYKNIQMYLQEKYEKSFSYRDVLLELYKGKMTTNPICHSGEGIFFSH